MTSAFQSHWGLGPFAPSKGSAAFTPTPIATPDVERRNHFADADINKPGSSSARSASVESNSSTLVDADVGHGLPPDDAEPPTVDGSSRGIVPVQAPHSTRWQWAMTDRELYHRLQNLPDYPSSIPLARRRILNEMQMLLSNADSLAQDPLHIFSLPRRFDATALRDFLQRQHDATTRRFAEYDERRAAAIREAKDNGAKHSDAKRQGMEMFFGDRQGAKRWMRRASVVKYVDGAWLQHLLRTTTGVPAMHQDVDSDTWRKEQRKAARDSWQVMSEELGDGDLSRSHVAIYEKNMDDLAREDGEALPPKGEDRAFTEWAGAGGATSETSISPGIDSTGNERCWRAALAQLSLSVSPNEFLPEAIGWNASYEGLPYHLLVSSRELQELDLDAYYFWLHVSIDNASTGHAAMARECIVNFVEGAKNARGQEYADEMWARIKLGFALADFIPTTPLLREDDVDETPPELTWTVVSEGDVHQGSLSQDDDDDVSSSNTHWKSQMVDVFKSKSATAHGLHAGVKARIAGESLSHWLDPAHVEERAPHLLDALAANPVWIVPGSPNDSKFVKEFEWEGKMFGAMTGKEVDILRKWVETLRCGESPSDKKDHPTVALATDEEAEATQIEGITAWLASASGAPSTQVKPSFNRADFLRPFTMPASVPALDRNTLSWDSWSQNAAGHIYSAVLARPDCVRTLPRDFGEMISKLAEGEVSASTSALPSANASRALGESIPLPQLATPTDLHRLLPILANTSAPIEQIVSISPGRLASPLGMACIKLLRVLHGFTELSDPQEQLKNGGDGRETGCMGTEDIENDVGGLWDALQDLQQQQQQHGSTQSSALRLEDFTNRSGSQLGLSSILLVLSSHFWEHAPLSFGIVLALCSLLANRDVAVMLAQAAYNARAPTGAEGRESANETLDAHVQRVQNMLNFATLWTERAIQIGLEDEQQGKLPRGVGSHCNWSADVQQGWRLASNGVRHALSDE